MKSSDAYRFTLSWPMETKEQIMAGEFLGKLGNKKSRLIIQLICTYLENHPGAMDKTETIQFIINSTSLGEQLTEAIQTMIQKELADKVVLQKQHDIKTMQQASDTDNIHVMFENLDVWNL